MTRISPISGSWYAGTRDKLRKQIDTLYCDETFGYGSLPSKGEFHRKVVGIVVPHAGYRYSGYTASHSYAKLYQMLPSLDLAIIIGPNHTGLGSGVSFSKEDWETPFGKMEIDKNILKFAEDYNFSQLQAKVDEMAHLKEHSIEIQLPFLQYLYDDFKIFPICMWQQDGFEELALFLKDILEKFETKSIAIIASSDLSHEHNYNTLVHNDEIMRGLISKGNSDAAYKFKKESGMTMCGYGPVFSLLRLNEMINVNMIEQLAYSNSSQITNNYDPNTYRVGYSAFYCTIR